MPAPPAFLISVCTNRTAEEASPTIEAAAGQARTISGARLLVVTSGLSAAEHAGHVRLSAELGTNTVPAAPGAAVARNVALSAAADEEILVFLDDDVLPHPDWLERLAAHWAAAPDDVACIGGAVEPRWGGPRPQWLGEGLSTAFALLDLGPGVVELEPDRGMGVWTANASFRARALRAAGGFPLHLGPWRGVAIIGEDSAAQRRLADMGTRIVYAGDIRVSHLIPAERLRLRDLWRREALRGASEVLAGTNTSLNGALRAPKAAIGIVVATARGDRALAGERLARLARTCGAAATPLIRARLRRQGWPG